MSLSDRQIRGVLCLSFVVEYENKLKSKVLPHYWGQTNSQWSKAGLALWWKWVIEHFLLKLFFWRKLGILINWLYWLSWEGKKKKRQALVVPEDTDSFLSTEKNRTACMNTRRALKVDLAERTWELSTEHWIFLMWQSQQRTTWELSFSCLLPPLFCRAASLGVGAYSKRKPPGAAAWLGHELWGSWKQEIPKQHHSGC